MRAMRWAVVWLALASPASAATVTIDNLWPYADVRLDFVSLWLDVGGQPCELLSADYGIRPADAFALAVTQASPLSGGQRYSVDVPWEAARFSSLTVGGPCPHDCSWGTGEASVRAGVWLAPGMAVDALWPSADGQLVPVARVSFTPSVAFSTTVPEAGTKSLLLLCALAGLVLCAGWKGTRT